MFYKANYNTELIILLVFTTILIIGCGDTGTGISGEDAIKLQTSEALGSNGKINTIKMGQDADGIQEALASLRRATAPFHNLEKAKSSEYATPITPCWYHSELGAMGYHYGNLGLLDEHVELLKPEALMYEPGPTGHYRLVGMEYIVPMDAWDEEGAPTLLGQNYHPNETLGLYTLHVWLWRENPNGMFAAWNPQVSCQYAEESEDRAGK